jgi:FAD/FMN-containing dehydrogenase
LAEIETRLRRRLEVVVGPANVLVGAESTGSYTTDWTSRWSGEAAAVVRPGSTAEVVEVLRACTSAGLAVVPQGGNTSLAGGSVPRGGEIVLSTSRLRENGAPDGRGLAMTVGAGVVLAAVQERAHAAGLAFGVDLAARGTATIGGMAATNAGGLHVVAHGSMLQNIRGIEFVLADGRVIDRLAALPKDTAGYDLTSLVVGSEGTLGVITRLRLRLIAEPRYRACALLGLRSVGDAVTLAASLPTDLPHLRSLEFVLGDGMELVCQEARLSRPFPERYPCYLFVEVAGVAPVLDELTSALIDRDEIAADVVATGSDEVDALLRYREGQTEAIRALGVPRKFDVAVPLDGVEAFLATLGERLQSEIPGARCLSFGHLAEGNIHVNVLPPDGIEDERVEDVVLGLVLESGGTISAEHGIGIAKAHWLERMRGADDVSAMRSIKAALDPGSFMNPGVIFPL